MSATAISGCTRTPATGPRPTTEAGARVVEELLYGIHQRSLTMRRRPFNIGSLFPNLCHFRPPRLEGDDTVAVLTLLLPKIRAQRGQVVIESREQFLASGAGFLDDWVVPHCGHRSISSCGVQMTGGSYPDALH